MYINPIAKARFENQKAIYKEENEKLKERWEKERAAEEKAARIKENDLIGARYAQNSTRSYRPSSQEYSYGNYGNKAEDDEDVFEKIGRDYEENARKEREIEEKRWEGFGDFFAKEGGVAAQNANQRNETFMKAYKNGEDWLMNGDDDSLIKAIINRLRSAPGEGVEDLAYLINDVAPWYKPAKEVVDKNVAGNIATTADRQFEKAKEKTGDFGDRFIDSADFLSSMISYGTVFGPSNLAISQGLGKGLDEYRYQRENGVNKAEAFFRGGTDGATSYLVEKLGGIGVKNSAAPKLKISNVASIAKEIFKNASQESGEEFAEYAINSFTDALADKIYQGEITIDWDTEELLNNMVTGFIVGGSMGASAKYNGRELDIVDEMNRIINEGEDIDVTIKKAEKLYNSLSSGSGAKKEVEKLIWYLKNSKTMGVRGVTRNAWDKPVIKVNHSTVYGAPNSITQKQNANGEGGIVRNYYKNNTEQYKQISNNDENKAENKIYVGGIHAHDYDTKTSEIPQHKSPREMKTWEILENKDILKWK